MIPAIIQNLSFDGVKSFAPEAEDFIDTKVKQIALLFFSSLFVCGALFVAVQMASKEVFFTMACVVSAGIIYWLVTKSKNYEDPQQVLQFRREAKSLSLYEIIELHGWKNMCIFEIPSKDDFADKLNRHLDTLPLNEALAFYEEAKEHLEHYYTSLKLPPPDVLKNVFKGEQERRTPCALFLFYDMDKLYRYGIIPEDWKKGYNEYKVFYKKFEEEREQIQETCRKDTEKAIVDFSGALDRASKLTGLNPTSTGKINQWVNELRFLKETGTDYWRNSAFEILKELKDLPQYAAPELLETHYEQQQFAKTSYKALETKEKAINTLIEKLHSKEKELNERLSPQGNITPEDVLNGWKKAGLFK